MKAILSTTYDDQYLFNLPIVTWAWKQLGVDVICFLPYNDKTIGELRTKNGDKYQLVCANSPASTEYKFFDCSPEKAATYAQVSRLFGCYAAVVPAYTVDLSLASILITSDVDMLVKTLPYVNPTGQMAIVGHDLTPENQYPMCYASGSILHWWALYSYKQQTLQQALDEHLAGENCENMRGNLWSRDQELLYNYVSKVPHDTICRARPGTQFASNRIDRDDSFWEDRLNHDIIDVHLWRPLYEEANFAKLMKLMTYFWPHEAFTWLIEYRNAYVKLL